LSHHTEATIDSVKRIESAWNCDAHLRAWSSKLPTIWTLYTAPSDLYREPRV